MSSLDRPSDPIRQLAQRIDSIESALRAEQQRTMRIPILGQDPPETSSCNIWLLHDGRLRTRKRNSADTAWVIDEWVRTAPGSSTSATSPPAPPAAPISREKLYSAVWSSSYNEAGDVGTGDRAIKLYYGWDSSNGRNRSYIGFDHTTIASDLSGSTVNQVRLVLTNLTTGLPNGADVNFGIHNVSGGSAPATWQGVVVSGAKIERLMPQQLHVINLPLSFATYIRDGLGKGIAIEVPDNSPAHYGSAAGVGAGFQGPTLEVSYIK